MAKDVIARLKADTSDFDSKFKQSGRALEQFKQQGINVDGMLKQGITSLAKYTTATAAVSAALKVAKDAFFKNELALDEWGRCVESAKGVYGGFLDALNNGDISGYLNNIDQIIKAAREAYNALDELGTFQAFNQVNQARNKAGYAEALEAYKLNPNDANKKALTEANDKVVQDLKDEAKKQKDAYVESLEELFSQRGLKGQALEDAKKLFQGGSYADLKNATKGYEKSGIFERSSAKWNGQEVTNVKGMGYYMDKYGGIGKDMSKEDQTRYQVAKALSQVNDEEIKIVQQLGAQAYAVEQAIADQNRSFNRLSGNNGKATTGSTGSAKAKETEYTYKGIDSVVLGSIEAQEAKIKDLTELWRQAGTQGVRDEYAKRIENANAELDRMKGKVPQTATGFSGPSTSAFSAWASDLQKQMATVDVTTPLYQNLQAQLADTTALQGIVKTALENGLNFDEIGLDVEGLWSSLLNAEDIENCDWDAIVQKINEKLAEKGIQISFDADTGNVSEGKTEEKKGGQTLFDKANQLVSGMTQLSSGLKGLGLDLGEGFDKFINGLNSVMQIVSGVKTIIDIFQIPAQTLNTAALTANTAALWANVATSWLPFSEGGVVHAAEGWHGMVSGGSYVGDTVPAMLNAGEIVLSASMQQNLASNLAANGGGGGGVFTIKQRGEDMITTINAAAARKGLGKLQFG